MEDIFPDDDGYLFYVPRRDAWLSFNVLETIAENDIDDIILFEVGE